ncbi:VOC family protein [Micromonospora sp. NPDC047707]|uniref:VOC family protein n=1 Tax=unclassified Micromonospora TaxID=2617518 RepID=UPI0012B501E2|nr:VOC family protein [Micromonospora sp. WMMC415]QGN47801.1 glyoxalase [Micromonospora sp. WMMC415]
MRSIYPTFRYPDGRGAIEWLCRAFGFRVHEVHETPDGSVTHAELIFDDGIVMVGTGPGPRSRPADDDYAVYVAVDDLDAHHERARAAGAEIVRAPFDTDYGSRDYAARDPAGRVWSFGTYRP